MQDDFNRQPSGMASPGIGRPDWRFGAIVGVVFAALLVPRLAAHVCWRDEWQSWLIANDGCDFPTLIRRASYEGHPALWYVLLWAGSHVSRSPVVMQAIHGAVACGAVFVLATFAPLTRLLRGLACANYFVAFEYAVVSRNYGMGLLALLAYAAFQTWRPNSMWPAALMLAIAAQTNALAAMLSLFLAIWTGARWWLDDRPQPRRFAVSVLIVATGFALAFLTLRGPADRSYTPTTFDSSPMRLAKMAAAIWRSFVPLPSVTRAWWATNLLDVRPKTSPLNGIQSLLGIATFFTAYWLLPTRRGVRWLWVGGTAFLVAFGYLKFTGSLRHHGHFFLLFFIALWLGGVSPDAVPGDRRRRLVMTGLFVTQAVAGVIASTLDVTVPFSASRAAGEFIASKYPNAAVIGQIDFSVSPLAGLLDRPLYYPVPGRWGTFVIWDTRRGTALPAAKFSAAAEQVRRADPHRPILVVVSDDAAERPDDAAFRNVARFADSSIESERYTIYAYQPAGDAGATTRPAP